MNAGSFHSERSRNRGYANSVLVAVRVQTMRGIQNQPKMQDVQITSVMKVAGGIQIKTL